MATLKKQRIKLKYDALPKREASSHDAIFAFIVALLGFIPLFNYFLGPVGLYLGIRVYKRIGTNPERFKGKGVAIAAIVIGGFITIFNIVDLIWLRFL